MRTFIDPPRGRALQAPDRLAWLPCAATRTLQPAPALSSGAPRPAPAPGRGTGGHVRGDRARGLGMAERMLTDRIGAFLGEPVVDVVRFYRLYRARRLLALESLSVGGVAQAIHYTHGNALGRIFRREVGVPPRRYRREVRAILTRIERQWELPMGLGGPDRSV